MIHDTSFNKMLFLQGEGANGKSVILTVMVALLGKSNVSGVGLENFNPTRTFPLAQTIGKLANLVPELSETTRAEEGVLKAFSSGDLITVERKFRDPIEIRATARLVFATNNMPHFKDKSDGIYRRILLIPMTVQLLDESKRDVRLTSPKFWEESGELPGIFNWALEGLSNLLNRGYFEEPKSSQEAKDNYRASLNPEFRFLEENIEKGEWYEEIITTELYDAYKEWCGAHGSFAQNEARLADELRKMFPTITRSENALSRYNPKTRTKVRARIWRGIKLIDGEAFKSHLSMPEIVSDLV